MNKNINKEQKYLDALYVRLDDMKAKAKEELSKVRIIGSKGTSGTPQSIRERDAFATHYENRLAQLMSVDEKLMFGKLTKEDGQEHHIGRISMSDDEKELLLLDWRAPEAGAFYQATPIEPLGVKTRRHIMTKKRKITALEDENLAEGAGGASAALLAAVNEPKTGTMGDIVATIHNEQDNIIRSAMNQTLVVQGAPGTGKTAIALHRTAYLLYTHRDILANNGVLLLGPSSTFLNYIDNVLPSLGETGVVMGTVDQLYPAAELIVPEKNSATQRVKGSLKMKDVLKRAVAQRENIPEVDKTFDINGKKVKLSVEDFKHARHIARISHKSHNEAWEIFAHSLVEKLASQFSGVKAKSGVTVTEGMHDIYLHDVRSSKEVRIAINTCWMPLTPEQLLKQFFARKDRVDQACHGLFSDEEAALLYREKDSHITSCDLPLLDELTALLGPLPGKTADIKAAKKQREADVENAKMALINAENKVAITAEYIADQFALDERSDEQDPDYLIADQNWAFKHIVVDEAQELSAMQWNMVLRRCPLKSLTIVGDVAQTSSPAGAHDWREMLEVFVGERLHVEELSINYRTPAKIMDVANAVAQAAGLDTKAPEAVREGDYDVGYHKSDELQKVVNTLRAEDEKLFPTGQTAVIAASGVTGAITPEQSKGLEFDAVIVVEPEEVLKNGTIGDLYVALTRASQKLDIVYAKSLPAGFSEKSHRKGDHDG
ncbi:MAG: AAA family ATPase [Micrococcaceae bacterium]